MGLGWWSAGMIMYISIIGIPFGKVCIAIGQFNFSPFGKEAINKNELYGKEEFATDCQSLTWNQLWFLAAGWWLALGHLVFAIANFITIVGIPSGRRHLQLACISLTPIGKIIVAKEAAVKAKKTNALQRMQKLKNELSV